MIPTLPQTPPAAIPAGSAEPVTFDEELRHELNRIEREEQVRIDRERQAELARLRELARFD